MKKIIIVFSLVVSIMAINSGCSKETGPTGPAGPQGPTGAQGAKGNANVRQYDFGSKTVGSSNAQYTFPGMTAGMLDSSLVMLYYSEGSNQWNVAGGCGPGCAYQTIMYTDPTPYVEVYLEDPDGTSYSGADITWVKSRLVIIPANVFGKKYPFDINDYQSVKTYFGFKD